MFADRFWVGLYQDLTAPDLSEPAGGWRWINDLPAGYQEWAPLEPTDGFGNENYCELLWTGQLNDLNASHSNWYLVEWGAPLEIGRRYSRRPRTRLAVQRGCLPSARATLWTML